MFNWFRNLFNKNDKKNDSNIEVTVDKTNVRKSYSIDIGDTPVEEAKKVIDKTMKKEESKKSSKPRGRPKKSG